VGDVVELVPLDEVLARGGDHLDDEERARLHASIERGIEDVKAGRTVDGREVIARLRARAASR
jgi:predicted transcriptional regulator